MEAKMKSRLFPCLLFAFVERVGLRSQTVGLSESLDYSVELPQESLLAHLCLSWEYASPNAQSQVESLWSTYRVREGLFFLHLFPGLLLGQQRHHELPLTSRVPGKKTLLPYGAIDRKPWKNHTALITSPGLKRRERKR